MRKSTRADGQLRSHAKQKNPTLPRSLLLIEKLLLHFFAFGCRRSTKKKKSPEAFYLCFFVHVTLN